MPNVLSPTEVQKELLEQVSNRYASLSKLVKDATSAIRPDAQNRMREVGTSQMEKASYIATWALSVIKEHPEEGREAMDVIQLWAEADRAEEKRNPCADVSFPTIIRGWAPGDAREKDFPLNQPAAVLTQKGMDELLSRRVVTKETFSDPFVTNVAAKAGGYTVEGDYVIIGGVPLKRTDANHPKDDLNMEHAVEDGVTFAEPWVDRLVEVRRHLPFGVISTTRTWIAIWELSKFPWAKMKQRGGFHFLVMALYIACEWACRTSSQVMKGGAKDTKGDGFSALVLEAWIQGKRPRITQWMNKWRQPMEYKYISGEDVGFAPVPTRGIIAWSTEQRLKGVKVKTEEDVDTKRKNLPPVVVPETRMPFIERDSGAYLFQDAALTTMAPLRTFLCLSCAIETCGSLHLDLDGEDVLDPAPFNVYYKGALRRLGSDPGRVGKEVGGTVSMMYRLLLTDLQIMAPRNEAIPPDSAFQADARIIRHRDPYMLAFLSHSLTPKDGYEKGETRSMGTNRRAIALAIAAREPLLADGLMLIFDQFSGSDEAIEKYTLTNHNTELGDAITHLAHFTSIEGYKQTCIAAIPVKSLRSHAQRIILEDIDSSETRECHKHEARILEEAFQMVQTPDTREFFQHLHGLSNSKSAGWDRIAFKVAASEVTDLEKFGNKTPEGHVSNRKDVLHFTAPFVLTRDYLLRRPGPESPLPLGIRSVPGRDLRPVYNTPKPQQTQIRILYKALEAYMKSSDDGYALAKRKGVPVADRVGSLQASIIIANAKRKLSLALDASRLDQKIGPGHRRESWRKVLTQMRNFIDIPFQLIAELEELAGLPLSGMTFGELVAQTLAGWDESYYVHKVPGAPSQLIRLDSEPSGALITAVDNTLVTTAMLNVIQEMTQQRQLDREMWGDDCWILYELMEGDDAVRKAYEADTIAHQHAGQKLDTVDGSVSGKSVHFLQVLEIAGQQISRRISYDHEKQQGETRLPGDINELVDKLIKLTSRGGNRTLLNEMMLVTIIEGSYTTQFGRQATTSFESIAAPGGHTNMTLIGYGLPNSHLFLSLIADDVFPKDTLIEKKAKRERPEDIGEKLRMASGDTPVRGEVGGKPLLNKVEGRPFTLNELSEKSSLVLTDRNRLKPLPVTGPIREEFERLKVMEEAYVHSVRRTGYTALGSVIQTKRLAPKFTEQALIKGGYITRDDSDEKLPKLMTSILPHKGFVIGKFHVTYSLGETFFLYLPNWHTRDVEHNCWNNYELRRAGRSDVLRTFDEQWHPVFSMSPENMRLLLGFTGIHAGYDATRVSEGAARFSPAKFRHDLTPERVMDVLERCKDFAQVPYLKAICGFNDDEISRIMSGINDISLYRSVKDASEFSSLPDMLKSASIDNILELILITAPGASVFLTSADKDVRNVIVNHYMSLLYELLNITCTLHKPSVMGVRKFIALPQIEITRTSGP